jgi:hypothetical protein
MSHLWMPIVERAKKAHTFDNRLCDAGGSRFLTDPLAKRYISIPPDGGCMEPGMLPPQEMEVRAALVEAIAAFEARGQVGFWKRFMGSREAKAADTLVKDKVQVLKGAASRSREHRAAAIRIRSSYPGTASALLRWAEELP